MPAGRFLVAGIGEGLLEVLKGIPVGSSTSRFIVKGKGSLVMSISNCCNTEKPPPEYRNSEPGNISTLIAGVLAGFSPSRICCRVGVDMPEL